MPKSVVAELQAKTKLSWDDIQIVLIFTNLQLHNEGDVQVKYRC